MNGNNTIKVTVQKRNIIFTFSQIVKKSALNFIKIFIKTNTYVEIICALIIILFIYTGLHKIMDYSDFKLEMQRSPFIQNFSSLIAVLLPPGELVLSFLLIIRRTRLLGLYFSLALMALFTGYIWLMLNYAYDLPCSCGGIISKMSWSDHLIFNSCFTGLAMAGVIMQSKIIRHKQNLINL